MWGGNFKAGFCRDCDRRWASTLSRWKPHIYPKEFAQDSGSAICTDFRNHHLLLYPPFSRFWRSYPSRMPGLAAGTCTNSVGGRANPPGSGAVLGLGQKSNVLGLPPQTWRHSRFCHCRDRRVAPCWAVCAHEGANERLRAEPSSSARALWAHLLRRASGEASHPVRSCWRCSGSACDARWASSRMRSRRRHEPFLCSLLVSSGRLERASRGSLVGLQL